MYQNITTDIYGNNMQRKDAEPTPKRKFPKGFRPNNQVVNQVAAQEEWDTHNWIIQENERLHQKQSRNK